MRRLAGPWITSKKIGHQSASAADHIQKPALFEVRPIEYDRDAYKRRNLIERCVNRLKQFRRIATRYEKTARAYLSMLCIASTMLWMKTVNTTEFRNALREAVRLNRPRECIDQLVELCSLAARNFTNGGRRADSRSHRPGSAASPTA
jgi:hypothetical protein